MNFDKMDLRILGKLSSLDEGLSVGGIVKDLYSPDDRSEYKKYHNKVRSRIEKYERKGILEVDKDNGRKEYVLNLDDFMFPERCELLWRDEDGDDAVINIRPTDVLAVEDDNGLFIYAFKDKDDVASK